MKIPKTPGKKARRTGHRSYTEQHFVQIIKYFLRRTPPPRDITADLWGSADHRLRTATLDIS